MGTSRLSGPIRIKSTRRDMSESRRLRSIGRRGRASLRVLRGFGLQTVGGFRLSSMVSELEDCSWFLSGKFWGDIPAVGVIG